MAKTEKKEVKKSTSVKKETKKNVTKAKKVAEPKKAETKKAVVKEEPKKLTTAKALDKIAMKPEPKKIAAKPEPKKIATAKEAVKLTVKEEVKPIEIKKPAKKATTKASTTKAVAKKAVKIEAKKETKPKTTAKKAAKKTVVKDKHEYYQALPLEECIRLMQEMQVHYDYDDYFMLLMDEQDLKALEKNIIEGNDIKAKKLSFEEHGYDEDLIVITLKKVSDTMDVKASDYATLKKQIADAMKFKMGDDPELNAEQYLGEFALSEKLLMIGQRKSITSAAELSKLIGIDVAAYDKHFFDLAYAILPTWQYSDVKFYEDFAYAIMSQYADVFEEEQLRVQVDVADLYIQHGDFQHGDELYSYLIRDNSIKDYIYFRYASIYKDIDYNKAKSIAYSALQYVDDRFAYYPSIMDFINQ